MTDHWLYALVLLAAVAHAVWNALVKGARDQLLMMTAIRVVGLAVGLALLPFVPWPAPHAWGWLVAAVLAHYAYYALLLQSYRVGDLSLVYPLARGTAPVLLALVAYLAIGERLAPAQLVAVALTFAGLMALVLGRGGSPGGIGFALATSVSIAAYSFLGGVGVRQSASLFGFQAWLEILCGVGMIGFALARRRGAALAFARAHGGTGVLAGAVSVAGFLAFLAAAQVLPLAPVAALRESSLIFGTVIGAVVFKEGFGLRRVAAAVLVAGGVIALAVAR